MLLFNKTDEDPAFRDALVAAMTEKCDDLLHLACLAKGYMWAGQEDAEDGDAE